jgi:hypothetical protein
VRFLVVPEELDALIQGLRAIKFGLKEKLQGPLAGIMT